MTNDERIAAAIKLAVHYGGCHGDDAKNWVIDQMVRVLAGERYAGIVAEAKAGEHGADSYDWDCGVAP